MTARELILRGLAVGPSTVWELLVQHSVHHRQLTVALGAMRDEGVIVSDDAGNLRLTPLGWTEARDQRLDRSFDHLCPVCSGTGLHLAAGLIPAQRAFLALTSDRPPVTTEFDQGVVSAGVAMARVALLDRRGDLAGKDLLFLGDDDLMSIACMLSGLPRRVTVLEIDPRVTAFLRKVAVEREWSALEIVDYDARAAFPAQFRGQFDVFFTDPVETVAGISLFLSRCIEGVRGSGSVGYFGLTHVESGPKKWLGVQQAALKMNLTITDLLRDFNRYLFLGEAVLGSQMKLVHESPVPLPPPRRLWYSSSIFRVEVVGAANPLITGPVAWGRELYADEDTL